MKHHYLLGGSTLLLSGLKHILNQQDPIKLTEFKDISETSVEFLTLDHPDFLWLEVSQNIDLSIKFCHRIHQSHPNLKTIVFCGSREPRIIKEFIGGGTSGYLLPECPVERIHQALIEINLNKIYIEPKLQQLVSQSLLQVYPSKPNRKVLTKRETEILKLIVEEYTAHEIANKLSISFSTVETHKLHMIQKLGVRNTAGLIREAIVQEIYKYPKVSQDHF